MFNVRVHEESFNHSANVSLPIPPFPGLVLVHVEGLQTRARIKTIAYVGGNMDAVVCTVEYY